MCDPADMETARAEWDSVREIVPNFSGGGGGGRDPDGGGDCGASCPREKPLVTFAAAVEHLKSKLAHQKPTAEVAMSRQRSSPLTSCCPCMTSQTPSDVVEDMRWTYTFCHAPFDNDDPVHFQMLLTLYKLLTGNRVDCPRYGSHWELIGFQGNDPSTDLRGVGLLGLLLPLYLTTTPDLLTMARAVRRVAAGQEQEYPLMVALINLARIAYDLLMEGRLKRLLSPPGLGIGNSGQDINCPLGSFGVFFAAVVFHYHNLWVSGRKTIMDSGYVLKDVESFCRSNPLLVVRNLKQHLDSRYSKDEVDAARRDLQKRVKQQQNEAS